MKKVVGIMMMLVMVFMTMTANAVSGRVHMDEYDAYNYIREWANDHDQDVYYKEAFVGDVMHYCGVLDVNAFNKETGLYWDFETWIDWSMDKFNMKTIEVYYVGETEDGIDVYRCYAESNEVLFTSYDEETNDYRPVNKTDILFVVCEI